MDPIWEAIKGLGALAGLASAGFLIWDRLARNYPTARLFAEPLVPSGFRMFPKLLISNPGRGAILVELKRGSKPGECTVWADNSIKASVASAVNHASTVAVPGEGSASFPVLEPPGFDEMAPDDAVHLSVSWQQAYSGPPPWGGTLRIKSTKRKLNALMAGTSYPE